jgi:hypothetical protein
VFEVFYDRLKSPNKYPDANYAEVTESGHLILLVQDGNPRDVVAVYAPGTWLRAEHVTREAA